MMIVLKQLLSLSLLLVHLLMVILLEEALMLVGRRCVVMLMQFFGGKYFPIKMDYWSTLPSLLDSTLRIKVRVLVKQIIS